MHDGRLDASRCGLTHDRFLDTRRGRRRRSRRTLEIERLRFARRLEARCGRLFARRVDHGLGRTRPARLATHLLDRGAVVPATSRRRSGGRRSGSAPAFAAFTDTEVGFRTFRSLGTFRAFSPTLACVRGRGRAGRGATGGEAFATATATTTTTTAARTPSGALAALAFRALLLLLLQRLLTFTDQCRGLEHRCRGGGGCGRGGRNGCSSGGCGDRIASLLRLRLTRRTLLARLARLPGLTGFTRLTLLSRRTLLLLAALLVVAAIAPTLLLAAVATAALAFTTATAARLVAPRLLLLLAL